MKKGLAYIGLVAGVFLVVSRAQQNDFSSIFIPYSLAFISYFWVVWRNSKVSWKEFIFLAIILRLTCIPFFPGMSDDLYRFYWDAMLLDTGISPYSYLPSELNLIVDKYPGIYNNLNSPDYYSIYPPLNQLLYWIAFQLSSNLDRFSICLKIIYLLIEIGGMVWLAHLLKQATYSDSLSKWGGYFLNPLVVIEGIGNLHVEVVMVSFLAGFFFYLKKKKVGKSALTFAAAVGVKLVPLLLVPVLYFRPNFWQKRRFWLLTSLSIFALLIPIVIGLNVEEFGSSLDLYLRKFEFNASFYYLFRSLGFQFLGYNLIGTLGPILHLVAGLGICGIALRYKDAPLFRVALFSWLTYLLFSSIVHPWYIIPLIFFGVIGGIYFPIVWSYLIYLSYFHYSNDPYVEHYGIIWLEYLLLFFYMIWESLNKPKKA